MRRVYSQGNRLSDIVLEDGKSASGRLSPMARQDSGSTLAPTVNGGGDEQGGSGSGSAAAAQLRGKMHRTISEKTDSLSSFSSPAQLRGNMPRAWSYSPRQVTSNAEEGFVSVSVEAISEDGEERNNGLDVIPPKEKKFSDFAPFSNERRPQPVISRKRSYSGMVSLKKVSVGIFVFLVFIWMFIYLNSQERMHDRGVEMKAFRLNYALIIDAGSSGSRVYVYEWPAHSGNKKDLLNISPTVDKEGEQVVKKVEPGLSSYNKKPKDAMKGIEELLLYAMKYVPAEQHQHTPLHIMATAGMRLIKPSEQEAIKNELYRGITSTYPFKFSQAHIEIITGEQEGMYAWIAANYVLGKFGHGEKTVGLIEMGGASSQVSFEVDDSVGKNDKSGKFVELNLGCNQHDDQHKYRLYVTTYLGYGANKARERYKEHVALNEKPRMVGNDKIAEYPDPCLPVGYEDDTTNEEGIIKQRFKGSGDFKECKKKLTPLLLKKAPCGFSNCAMNGTFQPPLDLSNAEFVGFSEFWYTSVDIFQLNDGDYKKERFESLATEYCGKEWSSIAGDFKSGKFPGVSFERFKLQCFKSAWISVSLHEGHGFPEVNKMKFVRHLKGQEVQWTLGAILFQTRFLPLMTIGDAGGGIYFQGVSIDQWNFVFIFCLLCVLGLVVYSYRRYRFFRRIPLPI
eukprot:Nk52_evm21s239 gene=Nk52_evmTU21s239